MHSQSGNGRSSPAHGDRRKRGNLAQVVSVEGGGESSSSPAFEEGFATLSPLNRGRGFWGSRRPTTRWRTSVLPSTPLPVQGASQPRISNGRWLRLPRNSGKQVFRDGALLPICTKGLFCTPPCQGWVEDLNRSPDPNFRWDSDTNERAAANWPSLFLARCPHGVRRVVSTVLCERVPLGGLFRAVGGPIVWFDAEGASAAGGRCEPSGIAIVTRSHNPFSSTRRSDAPRRTCRLRGSVCRP
jgi:hypothetical protein